MPIHTDDPGTLPAEQQRLRDRCYHPTGTFVPFAETDLERSVPEVFERQLGEHADRIAVKTPHQVLSYAQLNRAANRLAHAMLAALGPHSAPVPMLFDHDASEPIALLGVLKAGKAAVSLDPGAPPGQLAPLLDSLHTPLLVTQTQHLELAMSLAGEGWRVLNVEALSPALSPENPQLPIAPQDLSIIKLTSGSTGQPKGVIRNHRIALHTARTLINHFRICPDDRLLIPHSFMFDMFAGLLSGATVYPYDIRREGLDTLGAWMQRQEITYCRTFPTVYRRLMASLEGTAQLSHLRLMILSGESVVPADVRLHRQHCGAPCLFVNVLGSNEAGLFTSYFLDQQSPIPAGPLPVGYPIPGAVTCWLEAAGRRVGNNTVGEVMVQSPYLSLGYWKQPELTRMAFCTAADGKTRVYRSRDLALRRPDGCLVFMGREDFQVKIRGYLVEMAEIEAALLTLPAIKEGAVVARTTPQGDQELVAYLVPRTDMPPTVSAVRRHLAATLPEQMIPARFVILDHLPMLEDRKVHRQALPEPGRQRPTLDVPLVPPRAPVEARLVRIWSEVLGLEQVGIHDAFLELGGHSLLATQILARVIETWRIDLPLRALLEASSVAEMAEVIARQQFSQADPDTVTRLLAEIEALAEHEVPHRLADEGCGGKREGSMD